MNESRTVQILYEHASNSGRDREMRIMEVSGKIFPSGWSAAARSCDWCESSAALVFCRVDSAYLCAACDEGAHGGRRGGKHERVWMCEVCEQAPAAVTCKADNAALCPSCDRDIHSANPLARRHDRLPVIPFYEPAVSLLRSSPGLLPANSIVMNPPDGDGAYNKTLEEAEAASWLLPHPGTGSNHKIADAAANNDLKSGELLFGSADPLLDFDYSMVSMDVRLADSVVPVQKRALAPELPNHRASESCFDLDFTKSKLAAYSDSAQSLSQSVSSDVGVVPESNSLSDASYSFGRQIRAGWDPASSVATQATQLSGTEREARVMRYREKRKNRKFEKTIRYASRKAYAETRPRIKGRFAKRAEMEAEVDACFYVPAGSVAFEHAVDPGYGVVPSF